MSHEGPGSEGRTPRYSVPPSPEEAAATLRKAAVPEAILAVLRRLQGKEHAAVLVGGSVRDALLGAGADGDWDVATSATPIEVQAVFRRTVATGLQHGTVTVLVSPDGGGRTIPVEVTTFRGEGDYVDGRRPSEVQFHRDLTKDLARRDFTINALAWDPVRYVFTDPFGGLEDLRDGVIRAVGAPLARLREDGLRTMRAVRFCATRGFSLEPATQAAIPEALDVLAKVSRERVRVELFKLLGAPRPSAGLVPMATTGIWPHVLAPLNNAARDAAIDAVDALPADPVLRLARLLWPVDDPAVVGPAVEALRPSKADRARVLALTGPDARALAGAHDPVQVRRIAAALGRGHVADALAVAGAPASQVAAATKACEGAALTVGELALRGADLVDAGLAVPGPALGVLLRELLDAVVVDPGLNEPQRLLAHARTVAESDG